MLINSPKAFDLARLVLIMQGHTPQARSVLIGHHPRMQQSKTTTLEWIILQSLCCPLKLGLCQDDILCSTMTHIWHASVCCT